MFTPFERSGAGIHTGAMCAVRIAPSSVSGVTFETPEGRIRVRPEAIDPGSRRATDLREGGARVRTVEHLLAALSAFAGVDVTVEVDGPELPALDGSALPWIEALDAAGATRGVRLFDIDEEIRVSAGASTAVLSPLEVGEEPEYTVRLSYDPPWPLPSTATYRPSAGDLTADVAPARTYALERELAQIEAEGLGRGGSVHNALIIGDRGPLGDDGLRFDDEPARHKLLDAIGDLFVTGALPRARLTLTKPGHRINHELVRLLGDRTGDRSRGR